MALVANGMALLENSEVPLLSLCQRLDKVK